MKNYRVRFEFNSMMHGFYYSEWFDTLEEAKNFIMFAEQARGVLPVEVEDEEGETV